MNSSTKGEIACKKLDVLALEKGWAISVPIGEIRYDRIIDKEGKLYRVQVKHCDRRNKKAQGSFCLSLGVRRNGKNSSSFYTDKEIDALVVYLPYTGKFYWFSSDFIHEKHSITLRVTPSLLNFKNITYAKDFEIV